MGQIWQDFSPMNEFWIDKTTGTPADTLLAFGVAALIDRLLPEGSGVVLRLVDPGQSYQITLSRPLEAAWVADAAFFDLFPGLDTAKVKAELPQVARVDYIAHQQRNGIYFEARKAGHSDEQLKEQGIEPPHPDWPAWAVVNQMSAVSAYNGLAELWHEHQHHFPALLTIILGLYGRHPNDVAQAQAAWAALAKSATLDKAKADAAQLQVVNPGMGKGGNRGKADGLGVGGLSGFWIPEYLKFAGLFQAGLPRTVKGSKDRKSYILRPKNLAWRTHRRVFPEFQSLFYSQSAVKMDIMAVLRYCQVFLQQWKAGQATGRFAFARGQPGDHIAAIEVISYKHLGSAHATMNLSSMVLPLWISDIETPDHAQQFLELLEEHEGIIRNLEEERGPEYELLRHYRDFLSARDLRAFYRFSQGYANVVMRKLAAGGYPPRRFTISNLEVLIMAHNPKLAPILEDEGFRYIADAIRNSTVVPQYFKSKGQPGPYEIRYGLGNDLLRNASYPDKFAQALSKFLFAYNQETAQVLERYKGNPPVRRKAVPTTALAQLLALIDRYDAETVANLLVAFGYARDVRDAADAPPATPAKDESPTFDAGDAE